MPILFLDQIPRQLVRTRQDHLWLYGRGEGEEDTDSMEYPAREMHGERNAIGIRLKAGPGYDRASLWSDKTLRENQGKILEDLQPVKEHLISGWTVVIPTEGIINPNVTRAMIEHCPQTFRELKRQYFTLGRLVAERIGLHPIPGDTTPDLDPRDSVWRVSPYWRKKPRKNEERKMVYFGCKCGHCKRSVNVPDGFEAISPFKDKE